MITEINCRVCDETFNAKNTLAKYCSDTCKAKAWRLANPLKVLEVRKRHYEKNREMISKKSRDRYWSGGKEKSNKQSKSWYDRNKQKRAEYTKKYRKKKKELFDKYKDLERFGGNKAKVLARDRHKCVICFSQDKLNVHHIDGSGGGRWTSYKDANNSMKNLVTLCFKCHRRVHGYEHRNMRRFTSIEDIVRTMAKVIDRYRNISTSRKRL